jgi:hypothetical protein
MELVGLIRFNCPPHSSSWLEKRSIATGSSEVRAALFRHDPAEAFGPNVPHGTVRYTTVFATTTEEYRTVADDAC